MTDVFFSFVQVSSIFPQSRPVGKSCSFYFFTNATTAIKSGRAHRLGIDCPPVLPHPETCYHYYFQWDLNLRYLKVPYLFFATEQIPLGYELLVKLCFFNFYVFLNDFLPPLFYFSFYLSGLIFLLFQRFWIGRS